MISRFAKYILLLLLVLFVFEVFLQIGHKYVSSKTDRSKDVNLSSSVILCVGDSHTYGIRGVESDSYPAQLEAKLQSEGYNAEVVNHGVPGMNSSVIRRRLSGWMDRYRPSIVIMLVGVNNGWNRSDTAWSDMQDGIKVPFTTKMADFMQTKFRIVRALNLLIHRIGFLGSSIEYQTDHAGEKFAHVRDKNWEKTDPTPHTDRVPRDLEKIVLMVRERGATPLFMTYVAPTDGHFYYANSILRSVALKNKVRLVDNDRAMRGLFMLPNGTRDEEMFARLFMADFHLNPYGYDKVSNNILGVIKQSALLTKK